jgi:UDP-N-acetylmuramoyl-L-alanyl-D-glutamate--2,6-diaminopimelate ligase
MKLREVLDGVAVEEWVSGDAAEISDPHDEISDLATESSDLDTEISDLAYDSRRAAPGTLFFCVRGERSDGHEFAAAAVEAGASALVVEEALDLGVPQARVGNARDAMAPAALRFWRDPTADLQVAGITGTNGKTTTAFLVRHVLERAGISTGLLGTVAQVVGGAEEEVERTTPEAIDLQRTFRRMLDAGDGACAMEVSSHALRLGRVRGCRFRVAAFTNLTQDHLDFHADMEDYFAAKRVLFTGDADAGTEPAPVTVVNVDDPYGARLAQELSQAPGELIRLSSRGADAELGAADVEFDARGARFRCIAPGEEVTVETGLPGLFNVDNALCALAIARALGVGLEEAAAALADAPGVPGRMEPVDAGQDFAVIVDYAHTPDSVEGVLRAARELTDGRLIVVVGAGGDRDRDKRPLMGRAAAGLADLAVITSDNPRSEDPGAIIAEILGGIDGGEDADGVEVEPDRRAAIALALERAGAADCVVIAGKGHEQGQEFEGGRRIPFDDREVAREQLAAVLAAKAGR